MKLIFRLTFSLLALRAIVTASEPPVVIIYTANTQGFLEACGCAGKQSGGLAKRATMIKQLTAKYPQALVIDGGNLAMDVERCGVILRTMALMDYDAVGIGPLEVQLGADFLKVAHSHKIPVISFAGLSKLDGGDQDRSVSNSSATGSRKFLVKEIGGKRILVTSLLLRTSPESQDVFKSLIDELHSLRKTADLAVVISHLGDEENKKLALLANRKRAIDIIISNRNVLSTDRPVQPIQVGSVTIIPFPLQGKMVGCIRVNFDNKGGFDFQCELQEIKWDVKEDQSIRNILAEYFAAKERELINQASNVASVLLDIGFAPAEKCERCHKAEYDNWLLQRHSKAVETLRRAPQGSRLIKECLRCHSEHFRRTGVLKARKNVIEGVECASCHGDGIIHSFTGHTRYIVRKAGANLCLKCHDPENSPKFDYDVYLRKIQHWSEK